MAYCFLLLAERPGYLLNLFVINTTFVSGPKDNHLGAPADIMLDNQDLVEPGRFGYYIRKNAKSVSLRYHRIHESPNNNFAAHFEYLKSTCFLSQFDSLEPIF